MTAAKPGAIPTSSHSSVVRAARSVTFAMNERRDAAAPRFRASAPESARMTTRRHSIVWARGRGATSFCELAPLVNSWNTGSAGENSGRHVKRPGQHACYAELKHVGVETGDRRHTSRGYPKLALACYCPSLIRSYFFISSSLVPATKMLCRLIVVLALSGADALNLGAASSRRSVLAKA